MRESLLARYPDIDNVTLPMLVAIANAVERESVQRYETLASTMQRRGEVATAAAFGVMLDEERKHVDAVLKWSSAIGQPVIDLSVFAWRLPEDLSTSWDAVAGSALLTPYRAFAIAVDNEQRAFELYSYLSAAAADPQVAAAAERLAIEELRHAALMRRWRRQAWHRERRAPSAPPPAVRSAAELQALLARHEGTIATRLRDVATRLRAIGDEDSARVVDAQIAAEAGSPLSAPVTVPDDALQLLVAAQEPLEALSEVLEQVMRTLEGALFEQAERALAGVVQRLARIAEQAAKLQHPPAQP